MQKTEIRFELIAKKLEIYLKAKDHQIKYYILDLIQILLSY